MKRDIDAFLGAIAETPGLWKSVDLRVAAVWAEGAWHNLVARGRLDTRAPQDVPGVSDLPDLPSLTVLREVIPVESLPAWLSRVRVGRVSVAGRPVHFRRSGNSKFDQPYSLAYARRGLSIDGWAAEGPFRFGHVLSLSGESAGEFFGRFTGERGGIDALLRRSGWISLNEMLLRGLGDVMAFDSGTSARVTLVAPLEAALVGEECSWRNGVLRYKVLAGSEDVARRATLTVAGVAEGKRFSREVPLVGGRFVREKPYVRHVGTLRLPKAERVDVMLHLNGFELGTARVVDAGTEPAHPPLLKMAHDSLFSGPRSFEDILLSPSGTEGREFERAVAKLFSYCGLACDQPGRVPQEQNGPDVLVEIPQRNLLLVAETTVKHLMNDDGKLNRLAKRTANVRLALKETGAQIIPVMIVPWARETLVPVEMEEAERNGVVVLAHEDLADLLQMAMRRESPRQVAHRIVPEARARARQEWPGSTRNPMA